MTVLLEARNVTKIFGRGLVSKQRIPALENFWFSIGDGEPSITAVVGESGSGKTTMARLLLGLESPTYGQVCYRGKYLHKLSRAERLAFLQEVQMIFQDPFEVYNSFYTVDHVLKTPIAKFHLANTVPEAQALIEDALHAVGLRPDETLGRYPHQLSGGQRQRIMVARALLLDPRVIVADEPVSMIDASLRAIVLDNLRQLNVDFNISIVYITHDLTTAYQISHAIIVLYKGSVTEVGDAGLVVRNPQHPYTQLLVGSIPHPNPNRQWAEEAPPSEIGSQAQEGIGCKFAHRCPHAFPLCLEETPSLFLTDDTRAVACFLHSDHTPLPLSKMNSVFDRGAASQQGAQKST